MTTTQRESRTETEQRRRKQRDGGELTGKRLAVTKSSLDFTRFVYRWINDAPARLFAKTKEDDWDVVTNDGVKDDSADLGNAVSQIVGTAPDGSALKAYLCRKPRTFYDEDQKDKSRDLDKQLEQLRRGNDRAGGSQADYIPSTGIRMS
jgi:hypothetical protein